LIFATTFPALLLFSLSKRPDRMSPDFLDRRSRAPQFEAYAATPVGIPNL
jgi:hypothetical protein